MVRLTVVALLLALCASPLPAGVLTCHYAGGTSTTTSNVTSARPRLGGILYEGDSTTLTTAPCIIGLSSKIEVSHQPHFDTSYVMTCHNPDGQWVYHNVVHRPALAAGVWTWIEHETWDDYVSSLACNLEINRF